MTAPASRRPAEQAAQEARSWPQELSHRPELRIGDLCERLLREFPMLTTSKVRYFEQRGLVTPYRASSNQRLYSESDVERLRFILRQQRDRFLPLDQILEMLAQLDSGERLEQVGSGRMRVLNSAEVRAPHPGTRVSVGEVADLTGEAIVDIERMVKLGILREDARGRLTSQAPEIVRFAMALRRAGFEWHQVRAVATSAHAHAVSISQSVAGERAKKTPVAGERALASAAESAAAISRLYRALLLENVEVELR